jgi:hypothetical protein
MSTRQPASTTASMYHWTRAQAQLRLVGDLYARAMDLGGGTMTRSWPSWSSSAAAAATRSPSSWPAAAAWPCWTWTRTTGAPVERSSC